MTSRYGVGTVIVNEFEANFVSAISEFRGPSLGLRALICVRHGEHYMNYSLGISNTYNNFILK